MEVSGWSPRDQTDRREHLPNLALAEFGARCSRFRLSLILLGERQSDDCCRRNPSRDETSNLDTPSTIRPRANPASSKRGVDKT